MQTTISQFFTKSTDDTNSASNTSASTSTTTATATDEPSSLERSGTMAVTAEEGEEFVARSGGVSGKRRAPDSGRDKAPSAKRSKSNSPGSSPVSATSDTESATDDEDDEREQSSTAATSAATSTGTATSTTTSNTTTSTTTTTSSSAGSALTRKGTMVETAAEGEAFINRAEKFSSLQRGASLGCSMQSRYRASMVLAGVGDAMGYRGGQWEFNYSGASIHAELERMGGVEKLWLANWSVSDDQTMHLATAEALIEVPSGGASTALFQAIADHYVKSFEDMDGRAPGPTTMQAVSVLRRTKRWDSVPFKNAGGGCGGSMRAMCIGLRFPGEENRDTLIAVSIESGRMTHNHPTGFFGALVSALFTAYAVEGIPPVRWGYLLVHDILPRAYAYLEDCTSRKLREWAKYQESLSFFEEQWREYLESRDILDDGAEEAEFPAPYGVEERDAFYTSIAWAGWGGASGHDSVIIAYDALLGAGTSWKELVLRGVLHGGDNDSTGVICCAWWGAMYGFVGVPKLNFEKVEYRRRAEDAADKLYTLAQGGDGGDSSSSGPAAPSECCGS